MGEWSVVPEDSEWSVVPEPREDKVAPYGLSGVVKGGGDSGRPSGFVDRLKFAVQHPIESLKDEIPRAYEGAQAAADNILNGASFGAYRQVRDARSVPEALLNTAPASSRTQATERFNAEHPIVANASELAGGLVGGPKMLADAGAVALRPVVKAVRGAAQARIDAGKTFIPAGKAAGTAVGTMAGHSAVPFVGAPVGAWIGSRVGGAAGGMADRAIGRIAGQAARPLAADSGLLLSEAATRRPLAPLVPGASRVPVEAYFDEITGQPLTNIGKPVYSEALKNHATVGGGTVPNGLRADVVRAAAAARAEAMPPPGPPARAAADPLPDTLGADLAKTVGLLDDLRAGRITAQQARDAGLPSAIIAKALR